VGCGEDLWEGGDGLRWVGDGGVEDEDGSGSGIFLTSQRMKKRRRSWLVGFVPLISVKFQCCHGPLYLDGGGMFGKNVAPLRDPAH
jgi:hypothetical protein